MYTSVPQTSVYCFKTIIVSHIWNGFAETVTIEEKPVLSILEYRQILKDDLTPDRIIQDRINYLVKLTRKHAKAEIKNLC